MNKKNQRNSEFLKGKRGEYLVIMQFLLLFIFIFLPVYPSFDETRTFAATIGFRWIVLVLSWATALLLGGLGSRHIKKYLTPLPYPVDHNELVTTGIYALIRHPLYSSQLFAAFGWTIFSMSLSHLLLTVVAFFFFSYKAAKEENWLTERHPEYSDYARRVKKFIPRVY
ncbi:MAG: isoprenylcysteine carboxylmethyltransferase family protein [Chlorobiaceae bacterium]|jgi:protein-S-isoprenylcysteine O-methyltransferase Ste14|nr:isoprenylcysteine carboxylmethyltransferase family protein [Chlorobiaceae bacterium]NTW63142.1 isoprenylcysteine carboxylmethyltransferase family protein [Chlorobiaceae bacterium]